MRGAFTFCEFSLMDCKNIIGRAIVTIITDGINVQTTSAIFRYTFSNCRKLSINKKKKHYTIVS